MLVQVLILARVQQKASNICLQTTSLSVARSSTVWKTQVRSFTSCKSQRCAHPVLILPSGNIGSLVSNEQTYQTWPTQIVQVPLVLSQMSGSTGLSSKSFQSYVARYATWSRFCHWRLCATSVDHLHRCILCQVPFFCNLHSCCEHLLMLSVAQHENLKTTKGATDDV